ncbi:MAG: trypsin-like serine protease [Pseudomonadota bacterium]
MRTLFGLVVGLMLGLGVGIFADRVSPTRELIDPYFDTGKAPEAGDALLSPNSDGDAFTADQLGEFAIEPCFPRQAALAVEDRPWLDRPINQGGLQTESALSPFPDLNNYPGLIKIEGIRSAVGSEREHCAAARIAQHWFLTAAHCIIDLDIQTARPTYDVIAVTPSEDVFSEGTTVISIDAALCHSAYGMNRQQYPNDVALFYIENVDAFEDVEIVSFEGSDAALTRSDFSVAYVSGWGKNGGTRYLQGGPVSMSEIGEAVLISDRIGPRGPNVGDSGAPLYITTPDGPMVVGVLSQVNQDSGGLGDRGIYIRTKSIEDWIDRTLKICEKDGTFLCQAEPEPEPPTDLQILETLGSTSPKDGLRRD